MSVPNEKKTKVHHKDLSRRRFLKLGALSLFGVVSPCPVFAAIRNDQSPERSLSFYNTHTGESLDTVYWAGGKFLSEPLAGINYILRDHWSGEIIRFDTQILDLLHSINRKLRIRQPFHIISGYRSPKTNALLRKRGSGVARKSLHMYGKAVDVRLPGSPLPVLRQVAMDLRGGGVGYYLQSNFVHIDLGQVRYW